MKNIAPGVRAALSFVLILLNVVALVGLNWYDGLIKSIQPVAYMLNAGIAALAAGVAYGLLPGKTAVNETKVKWESGTDQQKQNATGYWKWLGVYVIILSGILFWYIQEM